MAQLILGKDDFPNIDTLDIGKPANICYGSVEDVTTHCIASGATSLLTSDITETATSFDVSDASRYPSAPFTVQVRSELMLIGAVSSNTFSSITRGYLNTTAKAQTKNQTVFEVRTEYVYLLSNYPVKAINDVYIDGQKQLANFTAYTGQSGDEHTDWPGKAVIAFSAANYIGKQFNVETDIALSNATGTEVTPTVLGKSDSALTDADETTWQSLSPTKYALEAVNWKSNSAYPELSTLALPTAGVLNKSGFYYDLETTGNSATAQPAWTTVEGSTITDNTCSWICKGRIVPNPTAWVAWDTGVGSIIKQVYTIKLAHDGSAVKGVNMAISNITSGNTPVIKELSVPGAGTITTFTIEQTSGDWDTVCSLTPIESEMKVYEISKVVTKVVSSFEVEDTVTIEHAANISSDDKLNDGVDDNSVLIHEQQVSEAWLGYPDSTLGTIESQVLSATITPLTTATCKLILDNDTSVNSQLFSLSSNSSSTSISSTFEGGEWDGTVKIKIQTGQINVHEMSKQVKYIVAGIASLVATSSARIVIGAVISADIEGFEDTTGDYGGVGTLIERPDYVLTHFIDVLYGFALSDIDTSSFNIAGALYASEISGGYKFGFVITTLIVPSQFVQELAFQCRSVLKYQAGKWFLDFLSDAAPAVVETIAKTELAGVNAKFQFTKTYAVDIMNNITTKFKRNYGFIDVAESEWEGTATAVDSTSQTLNGDRPGTINLEAIRFQVMADNVTAHILLQRKNSLLQVQFTLFWEHFDLDRGDTFDIDNPLYDATKFFIEDYDKKNDGTVKITGLQWY